MLLLVAAIGALAQTARFPTAVVTDEYLKVAKDRAQTTTNAALNASATTFTVVSGAKFADNIIVTIDSEQISVCDVSGGTFTVGHSSCPNIDGRGFNGTAAVSHSSGSLVSAYMTAWNHEAVKAEVKAIEAALGAGLSNVIGSGAELNSTLYGFTQAPGGSLAPGISNTVTLTPVPAGVNANAAAYFVYLSGGTGSAEVVLITGGTAVAGAATGTITFTPINYHAGAWTVTSATSGIQEAFNAGTVAAPSVVQVPPGNNFPVYATITMPVGSALLGPQQVSGYSYLEWVNTSGADLINCLGSNVIRGLYLASAAGSKGRAIRISGSRGMIDGVFFGDFSSGGIYVPGNSIEWRLNNFEMNLNGNNADASTVGIYFGGTGAGPGNFWISNFGIFGRSSPPYIQAGILWRSGGGDWVTNGYIANAGIGLALVPATAGALVSNIHISDTDCDVGLVGLQITPYDTTSVVNNITFSGKLQFNSTSGAIIGSAGVVADVLIHDSDIALNSLDGITIGNANTKGIRIHDCVISGNGTATANTYAGIQSDGEGTVVSIHHNRIGGGSLSDPLGGVTPAAETQKYAMNLGAGAGTQWIIDHNNVSGNVTGAIVSLPTGAGLIVKDNPGIDDVIGSMAAAASITLPLNPIVKITGNAAAIATMLGGRVGHTVTLIFTDAAPAGLATGGNIALAQTAVQDQQIVRTWDGTKWY
jgi:hypothetical protein